MTQSISNQTSNTRVAFLKAAKLKPYSIMDIVEEFNVSKVTAYNWTKRADLKRVEGSYPHQYVHIDNEGTFSVEADTIDLTKYVKLIDVDYAGLEHALKEVLESETPIIVADIINNIKDKASFLKAERQLIVCLQLARHYYEKVQDND